MAMRRLYLSNMIKLCYDIWSVSRYGQITMLSLESLLFVRLPENETELKVKISRENPMLQCGRVLPINVM